MSKQVFAPITSQFLCIANELGLGLALNQFEANASSLSSMFSVRSMFGRSAFVDRTGVNLNLASIGKTGEP